MMLVTRRMSDDGGGEVERSYSIVEPTVSHRI
jgi:hypothetical protein